MSADRQARFDSFFAAICAEPDSDDLRLIFADFLSEQREPELQARGEFIRNQMRSAQPWKEGGECWQCYCARNGRQRTNGPCHCSQEWKGHVRRERDLLRDPHNFCNWVPLFMHQGSGAGIRVVRPPKVELMGIGFKEAVFRRGFIEEITCDAESWLLYAAAIIAVTPLREVRLTTWPGTWPAKSYNFKGPKESRKSSLHSYWPSLSFTLPDGSRIERSLTIPVAKG